MTNVPSQRLEVLNPLLQPSFPTSSPPSPCGSESSAAAWEWPDQTPPRLELLPSMEKTLEGLGSLLKNCTDFKLTTPSSPLRKIQSLDSEIGIHEMLFIPDSPMQLSRFAAGLLRVQHSPVSTLKRCRRRRLESVEGHNSTLPILGTRPVLITLPLGFLLTSPEA